MIHIGMDPNMASIGSFIISWHGFFISVAIITGILIPALLAPKAGLLRENIFSIAIWAVPGGIIGARMIHVFDYWDFFRANPAAIFHMWEGGLGIWGAILGGTITALIYGWIKGLPMARYADVIGLGLIMAQAVGRIGDVINGEHFSKVTDLSWAVIYTHPNSPAFGLPASHPAVAYELIMDLLIFGMLWILLGRLKPDGSLFMLYLIVYSVGRFFLSYLRIDSNTVIWELNQPQWICLIVLAIVVPLMIRQYTWGKQQIS